MSKLSCIFVVKYIAFADRRNTLEDYEDKGVMEKLEKIRRNL